MKYNTLPLEDIEMIESSIVEAREVKIENTNNPMVLIDGMILVFGN